MLARFILYVVLLLVVYWKLRGFFRAMAQGMRPPRQVEEGVRMVRDPICGTFVIPGKTPAVRDAGGLHHFCSDKCRDAFVARARRS